MRYADLHVHTYFSDGTFSPEEVVSAALERDISCIGICDHDSVEGVGPASEFAKKNPIEIIPGVELTALKQGKEIHILGYFISWKEKWLAEIFKKIQAERVERMKHMIKKLKNFNIEISLDEVLELSQAKGSIGRLHLARALLKKKAIPSLQAAFSRYIGDFKPCYVEDINFSPKEAVEIILKAKGVPVLAHPGILKDDSLIPEFMEYGLRGIEVFHSDHSPAAGSKYEKIAKKYNLLVTGGSDCHGMGKSRVLMGSVKVPYSIVEKLKKEVEKISS